VTGYDLSGIGVTVQGLPSDLAGLLDAAWARFAADPAPAAPLLRARVEAAPPGPAGGPFGAKRMTASFTGATARYAMPEGTAEVAQAGEARIGLAAAPRPHQLFAFLNLVHAALAWVLPTRPALLLHAAAVELEGRAFVLVGAEGAGKTTWAGLARQAGGRVIHDDLVAIDLAGGGPHVLGWPVRNLSPDPALPGRWPLAALLLPRHAAAHALEPAPPALLVRARLGANVPFVTEALGSSPPLHAALDALVAAAPARTLAFARDPGFADLLRGLRG